MDRSRRGISTIAIVFAIVALGIAVLYFGSKVYRTSINNQVTQFSEWTPENITKDPEGYLSFRDSETRSALLKLNASEFGIIQKKARLEVQRDELAKKLDFGSRDLALLKRAYIVAVEKCQWPILWEEFSLSQDQAKRQIARLDHEITGYEKLWKQYVVAVEKLSVQDEKLCEVRGLAKEQLIKIDISRESLKIQGITADLKDSLLEIKSIINTPIFGASTGTSPASIEDLMESSKATVSDSEFRTILSK